MDETCLPLSLANISFLLRSLELICALSIPKLCCSRRRKYMQSRELKLFRCCLEDLIDAETCREPGHKRSLVVLCRAGAALCEQGARSKEIWICQNLKWDFTSHFVACTERTKCLGCFSLGLLSVSETSDSCKNQFVAVGGLCCLSRHMLCFPQSPQLRCKVSTTSRAAWMGNTSD